MSSSQQPYDYTRDDVPFADNPDDFLIGNVTGGAKSADEIEKENSFSQVPPGEHLLVVAGFAEPPKPTHQKVTLDGQLSSFATHSVRVRLALPDNPKCTINDFFLLPPDDPKQQQAYFNGLPEGKKQAGWSAAKFVHFINRIGFPWGPGEPMPEAARRLGNWKGRTVIATIEAGNGTYKDDQGNERQRGPQVKSFSYRKSDGAPAAGAAVGGAARTTHAGHSAGRPAMAGAGAGGNSGGGRGVHADAAVNNGLDNI